MLNEEHARWLEDARRLPIELAREMGIVSLGRNIAFEYRRNGELQWLQVRYARKDPESGRTRKSFATFAPDGKTTLKDAGIPLSFWQEDDLLSCELLEVPRIITEGQFDACAFRAAGLGFVGSVPNGAPSSVSEGEILPEEDTGFAYLWDHDGKTWHPKGGLRTCEKIILATDGDEPGIRLREELALRLGRDRCWYVTYPEGCKDANEVLVKFPEDGLERLRRMIDEAKPVVPFTLVPLSEIPEQQREVVACGWPDLVPHLRVTRPELMVITGPPNHGKSQFATVLCANLAAQHEWKGAILQFEDDVERIREDLTRNWLARNGFKWNDAEGRRQALGWIDKMFLTIAPDEGVEDGIDIEWLRSRIIEAARHSCAWVLIDPWNELEHVFQRGESETVYLNRAIRELKRLARRYKLCLIIVAHPDKISGREKNIDEWDLYAVSGGQTWNNKADHGIVVLRDRSTQDSYVKVSKSRRHAVLGRPGTVIMRFAPMEARYEFVSKYEGKAK